jgi:hypothetical protein
MEATGGAAVAAAAERLLEQVRHTHYQHDAVVDETAGRYDVDCAAFVGVLLESIAPEHFASFPRTGDERYPRAFEIFDHLSASPPPPGWRRVATIEEARPGDVISWRTPKVTAGRDTGHVLIVAKAPVFHGHTHAWTVHAYDSSNVAHHDDSRERAGKYHSGLGEGAIRFKVDASGAPTAFQFGPQAEFHTVPIVIARLHEMPHPKKKAPHARESAPPAHAAHAPHAGAHPAHAAAAAAGHRVVRAPAANEVLGEGEFAFTTYALAGNGAMLLLPTTFACWGPGQTIPASMGNGSSTYNLVGGVVFRNS